MIRERPTSAARQEVLDREPDLLGGLEPLLRLRAQESCRAQIAGFSEGTWDPPEFGDDPGGFGLLVLSGFLVRRVGQDGRRGAELIGPGDLLRPWQTAAGYLDGPFESSWTVISKVQAAVLDQRFTRSAAPYPSIAEGLVDRATVRCRNLAIVMTIAHQRRVDRRLEMLFWHLADRWGRVGPRGTSLPVPLTHSLLGELVVARRPTVSTAMSALARDGRLRREGAGWLMRGTPSTVFEEGDRPDLGVTMPARDGVVAQATVLFGSGG